MNIKQKAQQIRWKKIIAIVITVSIVTVFSLGGYFAWYIYTSGDKFDENKLLSEQSTRIFDQDGNVIYTLGDDNRGKRVNVTYEDLPQVLVDAVVSAEDSRYFEHDGFDLPRIAKTLLTNILARGITGGGSTITQQVVKKSYGYDNNKTYLRKIKEVHLAVQATRKISKEDILTRYLNKIYFGGSLSSVGIGAASKYYFNKEVQQLTLPEAALLAGTLNSPNKFDPYFHIDNATRRRNIILELMLDHGYISKEECDDAKQVPVENMLHQGNENNRALMSYIDMVVNEATRETKHDPRKEAMDIYTYIDTDLQNYLYDLSNTFSFPDAYMQVGASVQSTKDGRIKAVLPGRNYKYTGTNRATAKQQPGSSLKPVIDYGAAFELLDWSTGHEVEDKEIEKFKNFDGRLHGSMSISEALKNSWNLPAIRTYNDVRSKVGTKPILQMLEKSGVDLTEEDKDPNLAFAIGGWKYGMSPVESASLYATVSNGGKHIPAHMIDYISFNEEKIKVDEEKQKEAQQAFSPETAFMIQQVQNEYMPSYGFGLNKAQFLAKTGTSNYSSTDKHVKLRGKARDSWLSAYNPDYALSVWLGYDTPDANEYGLTMEKHMLLSRNVASKIIEKISKKKVSNSFNKPDGVYQAKMIRGSYPYQSPNAYTPEDKIITAWFKKGHGPAEKSEDENPSINPLNSFKAQLTDNKKIQVSFDPYNPSEAVTNPDANENTKTYGPIRYGVEIKDASSGKVLQTYMLDRSSEILDYSPTSTIIVSGYYTYKDAANIRSNQISQTLTIEQDLGNINYSLTHNNLPIKESLPPESSFELNIKRQRENSKVTITVTNDSGANVIAPIEIPRGNTSYIFTLHTAGIYKIIINESFNGKNAPPAVETVVIA